MMETSGYFREKKEKRIFVCLESRHKNVYATALFQTLK